MSEFIDKGFESRKLLRQRTHGILSTISLDIPGYPFGSVTPYTLTDEGEPYILISTLAQHTKNIDADSRVSLTIQEDNTDDPQAKARLTLIGDAHRVSRDANGLRAKYLRYFPNAVDYFTTHDFHFYQINIIKARYIGGFGKIFWVEREEILMKNSLHKEENRIVSHMNEDHGDALNNYCRVYKGLNPEHAAMIGIDAEGFDVLADDRFYRFEFESPISDAKQAREILVDMAKEAAV